MGRTHIITHREIATILRNAKSQPWCCRGGVSAQEAEAECRRQRPMRVKRGFLGTSHGVGSESQVTQWDNHYSSSTSPDPLVEKGLQPLCKA